MKAIQIHAYGGIEKLRLEEVPDPIPGPGELLVRTGATSVNPVDYKIRSGAAKERFPQTFPAILGRDLAGTVVALGAGVTGFAVGERVMGLVWRSYAELVIATPDELCRIPNRLEDTQAAAMPLVALTGAQLIENAGRVSKGQRVLVTGALGGVGRTAVFVAKAHGAHVMAGVRGSQFRQAQALGVERVIPLDDPTAIDALPELDVLADTIGKETTVRLLPRIRKGGILATVVAPPNEAEQLEVRIESLMTRPDSARLSALAEDVTQGRLILPVGRVFWLREAQEAHRLAEEGGHGKLVLIP